MSFINQDLDFREKDPTATQKLVFERMKNRQFFLEVTCESPMNGADYPRLISKARSLARENDVGRMQNEFLDELATVKPRNIVHFKGLRRGKSSWWAAIICFGDPTRTFAKHSEDGELTRGEKTMDALFIGWTTPRGSSAVLVDFSHSSDVLSKTRTAEPGAGKEYIQYMMEGRVGMKVGEGYMPQHEIKDLDLGMTELPEIPGLPKVTPRKKPEREFVDKLADVLKARTEEDTIVGPEPVPLKESPEEVARRKEATKRSKESDFWETKDTVDPEKKVAVDLDALARSRRKASDW